MRVLRGDGEAELVQVEDAHLVRVRVRARVRVRVRARTRVRSRVRVRVRVKARGLRAGRAPARSAPPSMPSRGIP